MTSRMILKLPIVVLAALLVQCSGQRSGGDSEGRIILTKACQFLWERQGSDGGWHSVVQGQLRSGEALTPYILFTLMSVADSIYSLPKEQVEGGVKFIREHTNAEGALGFSDPDVVEYPNYSTAYALRVLVRHGSKKDSTLIKRMTDYLVHQQFIEGRGIDPENPAYGSWGFGELNLKRGIVGHVDISHTRRVLQALHEAGYTDESSFT
ncbi:MAG TPA: prenyltransferase/squalene oxidase repeat-containing protein, partial [Bacteroidota bacterium]